MRRGRLAHIAAVVVVIATACSSSSHATAPATSTTSAGTTATGPACARPHLPGQSAQSFTFAGQTRTYQLFVPRAYDGHTPVPVVFNFHGYGSGSVQQMIYGNFKPLAERDNFLIVAPDGQGTAGRHFNFGLEPALQNDVQMAGALLDHLEATLCIDERRVFSTGMSNGGAMTTALACASSNRFAAYAAVTVSFYSPVCDRARPVPIMLFAGTADPVVPFNGGRVNCCGGASVRSSSDVMKDWAAHDRCAATFAETRLGSEVRRRTWPGCGAHADVVFYIIDGGGHTWPGAISVARLGHTTTQIDASATIWQFFKDHPMR